jgi:hypothetical protein
MMFINHQAVMVVDYDMIDEQERLPKDERTTKIWSYQGMDSIGMPGRVWERTA